MKISAGDILKYLFLYSHRYRNFLQTGSRFSGKIKKISVCHYLPSVEEFEFDLRAVKVNLFTARGDNNRPLQTE